MTKQRYTYQPKGGWWAVYKWKSVGSGLVGEKIAEYPTREQARSEVYRLNGWKEKQAHGRP